MGSKIETFYIKNNTTRDGHYQMVGEKIQVLASGKLAQKTGILSWSSMECKVIKMSSTPAQANPSPVRKSKQNLQEA